MENNQQFDITKYLYIMLRRKYLFIAVSLAVLSVIVWGSFFMPEMYEAKSTVFIEKSAIRKLINGTSRRTREDDDAQLRGLKHTMLSRKVLAAVIDDLDLDVAVKDESEIASMMGTFIRNTNINARNRENIFIVSYKGKDPVLVRDYVNTLIEKYIEAVSISKREDAYGASRFIAGQIEYYKGKIDDIEEELADFRRREGIYLATDETTLVISIKGYIEEIEDAEMEIKKLEARKNKIEQQISGEAPYTVAMIENEGGDSLPARLKSLQRRLQVLLTKYTENYPDVIRTKIEIDTITKLLMAGTKNKVQDEQAEEGAAYGMSMMNPIYQQLKEDLFNAESDLDSFLAKKEILMNRSKRAESELKNIPDNKKVLANLERDRETYQTLYEQLLAKLGQAEVNEQVEVQSKGETFKVIERAGLPRIPASPDRVVLIIFGIFAGIAAGIGIVLLMEKLDSSIRDVDILKTQFGVKVLAVIPEIVTEQDTARKRKNDMTVYTFSAIYLLIIGGVFIREFINRFL